MHRTNTLLTIDLTLKPITSRSSLNGIINSCCCIDRISSHIFSGIYRLWILADPRGILVEFFQKITVAILLQVIKMQSRCHIAVSYPLSVVLDPICHRTRRIASSVGSFGFISFGGIPELIIGKNIPSFLVTVIIPLPAEIHPSCFFWLIIISVIGFPLW